MYVFQLMPGTASVVPIFWLKCLILMLFHPFSAKLLDFYQGGLNSCKIFTGDYLIFSYKVRKLWHSSTLFSSSWPLPMELWQSMVSQRRVLGHLLRDKSVLLRDVDYKCQRSTISFSYTQYVKVDF